MDNTPSEYIGIEAPSDDPDESARELFGLETMSTESTNQQPQQQYMYSGSCSSDGPLLQMYTPMTPYYAPFYGYPVPIAGSSQTPLVGLPPHAPVIHQYIPHPYLPYDMTGVFCGAPMSAANPNMIFGMGYAYPTYTEEVEVYADSPNEGSCAEDPLNSTNSTYYSENEELTPTSHNTDGSRQCQAQRRLDISDEESNEFTAARLIATEGQSMDVDYIVQELIKQGKNRTEINEDSGRSDTESTTLVQDLSCGQRNPLEQMTVFDFQNLLRNGFNSLGALPRLTSRENISDANTYTGSSSVHRVHSLLEIDDHNIESMQSGLNGDFHQEIMEVGDINHDSQVTEEVVVETYQG